MAEQGATKLYEIGYHLVPQIPEESVSAEVEKIKTSLENFGGVIASEGVPQNHTLAYTISRMEKGKNVHYDTSYFGWIRFEMGAKGVSDFKKELEGQDSILRLIVTETVKDAVVKPRRIPIATAKDVPSDSSEAKGEKLTPAELDEEIEKLILD